MFNVGGGEFVVIAVLALIVLGPQRLPDAARQIGRFLGDLRNMSAGFQRELESALEDVDPGARAAVTKAVMGRVPVASTPLARGLSTAVAAVSAQGTPPADEGAAPTAAAPRKRPAPAKKAPAKKAPGKKQAPAKKAPAKRTPSKTQAAPKKTPVKKVPAQQAPAKKTAPAKKAAPRKRAGGA
jgi:Tat protein translocase TatB subunit